MEERQTICLHNLVLNEESKECINKEKYVNFSSY